MMAVVENSLELAKVSLEKGGLRPDSLTAALARAMKDNRGELVALHDQPAVAGRDRGLEAENDDRGALGQRRAQPFERASRDQRRIAERDQDVVGTGRDGIGCLQHRMRGAKPLALHEDRGVRAEPTDCRGDRLMMRRHHHRDRVALAPRNTCQYVRQQRLARDRVEHLRQRRAHSGAVAGRKHDGETGAFHGR